MNKYQSIIDLEHHTSTIHPRMPISTRVAIFAPFAALTGYEDAINETGRITEQKRNISDENRQIINERLRYIKDNIHKNYQISITYFIEDPTKEGGRYQTINNYIKKIDEYNQLVVLGNNQKIFLSEIISLSGSIFDKYNI